MAQVAILNARVERLETVDRQEHFDADGGGRIVRIFYCEPYTAHKRVVTSLKGTMTSGNAKQPNAANALWSRQKPHADPLYPWFFCNDVQVVPFAKTAARGQSSRFFVNNPANDDQQIGQFPAIQAALNNIDDFDGAAFIDNMTAFEIQQGYIDYKLLAESDQSNTAPTNTGETFLTGGFNTRGLCGCFIVATYNPLLYAPGISLSGGGNPNDLSCDPFDVVDPQRDPFTIKTQLGRQLQFWSPVGGPVGLLVTSWLHGGLSDTFELAEVVWKLSIRRLMVPFLPEITIGIYTNTINANPCAIGNLTFPPGTLRFDGATDRPLRGPDGNMWFELTLNFTVRKKYDEYWNSVTSDAGSYTTGWVDWNHQFGIPTAGILEGEFALLPRACYYPVCWNSGLFQFFGDNHPLYLTDLAVYHDALQKGLVPAQNNQPQGTSGQPLNGTMIPDLFISGFYTGQ